MKNPRISITPEAYKAIRIQAAIEGMSETDLLSEMVLAHISEETRAAIDAAAKRQNAPKPSR